MSRSLRLILAAALAPLAVPAAVAQDTARYGYGTPITPEEIAPWDIDVRGPDGHGLPPGSGSVEQGMEIWDMQCAVCHGDWGEGVDRYPVLMGGYDSLDKADPVKTVGSYWPYAPTIFDYVKRSMPFGNGQSLTDDEIYAVTAYILNLNEIIPWEAVMDAGSLAAVGMPNRDGFIAPDPRPDVHNEACMKDCRAAPPEITAEARDPAAWTSPAAKNVETTVETTTAT